MLNEFRNWLYIKLPHKKYDQHLSEYGFDVWNRPIQHKLLPPTNFLYDPKIARFKWTASDNAKEYRIEVMGKVLDAYMPDLSEEEKIKILSNISVPVAVTQTAQTDEKSQAE